MKRITIGVALVTFLFFGSVTVGSENELPMSDRIEILKITPFGEKTKEIFEIKTDDFTYENLRRLILDRIKKGYRPDCNCDFDNEYFIQLENRPIQFGQVNLPVEVKFKPFTEGSYKLLYEHECRILLSRNKKYAGLQFAVVHAQQQFVGHHFVMVNSRGDILWESDYKTINMPVIWNGPPITLLQDVEGYQGVNRVISNDGKLLVWKHILSLPEPWSLYSKEGKLLKTNTIGGRDPVFSDNGDYFLIQETRDPDAKLIEPDSGTACYNTNGDLRWFREDVLPFQNSGYCISPSGNIIIAYLMITPHLFDNCIIDNNGKLISKADRPYEIRRERPATYSWSPDESWFYWDSVVLDNKLQAVADFETLNSDQKQKYGFLTILSIFPLDGHFSLAVGRRGSDATRKFEPSGTYKWIGIYNEKLDLEGLKFIYTEGFADQNFRIEKDDKSKHYCIRSNDLLIEIVCVPEN